MMAYRPTLRLPLREAALALSLQLAVFAALGAPLVLYDSGATQSIEPYLAPVHVVRGAELAQRQRSAAPRPTGDGLPVHTPELSVGPLPQAAPAAEVLERLARLPQPVFLVGADSDSLAWLAGHRAALAEHGAVGFLVEAQTQAQLEAVRAAGEGLAIVPSSASQLAQVLGLTRYPVLLSAEGIEQ
jgi:integrating conjugative element protein (TIGR03765 family)